MGICEWCNMINLLRIVIGVFGSVSLVISGYYYFNNFNNLDCGDLKLGVGIGITSIFALVLTTLMYCSSCVESELAVQHICIRPSVLVLR